MLIARRPGADRPRPHRHPARHRRCICRSGQLGRPEAPRPTGSRRRSPASKARSGAATRCFEQPVHSSQKAPEADRSSPRNRNVPTTPRTSVSRRNVSRL
ncbi:MAG: hypothetical protein MZU97_11185 [Bacillus subtilis]|nr:hypothetical protein [Bacillus subtilis]